MGSTTISLERSAYEMLRHAKRPGESFSQVVRRLTQGNVSALRELSKLFDRTTADGIAATVLEWRKEDVRPLPELTPSRARKDARRTRH